MRIFLALLLLLAPATAWAQTARQPYADKLSPKDGKAAGNVITGAAIVGSTLPPPTPPKPEPVRKKLP